MNISNPSSVTSNPQSVSWALPTQQEVTTDGSASRPHAAHHHRHRGQKVAEATEASETSAVPDNDGDQDDAQSVSILADKVNARLQHMISTRNLTSDQAVALKDAAAKFQALMTRIGAAAQPDMTKRTVHLAMHELSQRIHDVFGAQAESPAAPSVSGVSGAEIAAAVTAPPIDTVA